MGRGAAGLAVWAVSGLRGRGRRLVRSGAWGRASARRRWPSGRFGWGQAGAVVASFFGTGDDLEAFLIAFLVPSTAMSVICGAFGSALILTYVQVREHGAAHAQALFSTDRVSVGLLGLVSMGFAAVLPYLASGVRAGEVGVGDAAVVLSCCRWPW